MVGLAGNTLLSSFENNIQKMSDSSGKEDVNNDKSDKPLSNGTEGKDNEDNKVQNESEENKMEVEEDTEEPEPEPATEPKPVVNEAKEDKGEPNNDVSTRRKSRSSRSQSTNSTSSVPPASQSAESAKLKDNARESDDEDFRGFESSDSELSKEKIEKIGNCIATQENPVNNESEQYREKSYHSEKSSDGLDTAETDSNSGIATPSVSRKGPRGSKKSLNIDLSNPEFQKPFEYGWVRELVYRSTSDSSVRRNADIYYYTPTGKKVRSSREILEHLTGSLTLDNFSFFKEPIGLDDPSKEIIREAKSKPGPRTVEDGPPTKIQTPKAKVAQVTPKVSPKETTKTSTTPKVVFRPIATPKSKPPSGTKAKLDKKRRSAGPDDVDVIMESSEWNSEQKNDPAREVCSIECRLAMGLIPDLRCVVCLCLYHPECCGFQRDKLKPSQSSTYVCKNCQKAKIPVQESLPPPPQLTPIVPVSRPKVTPPTTTSQPMNPTPTPSSSRPAGIVGAVTTWLAPSSSIQVTPQEADLTGSSSSAPQGIVTLNGKQYLFVPRTNVVNVNTQQPSSESGTVSNPPGLFLVPCDPPQQIQLVNGPFSHPSATLTNGVKRPNDSQVVEGSSPPEKKSKTEVKEERLQSKEPPVKASPHNFMMNLNAGFIALLHAFQYLKVYELLRAGCVSKMWQFVASHQSLWETVRMKNSRVSDWDGFGRTLSSHGTKYLDLRKMLTPEGPEEQAKMWEELCRVVKDIRTLIKVDMGRCSPAAFTSMAEAAPQLESLVSLAINWKEKQSVPPPGSRRRGNEIDLLPITKCKNLKELKLKAVSGGLDIKNLSSLKELKNLTTLALTTIKNLKGIEDYLPEGLVSLELGECCDLSKAVATEALPKLKNLKRLRLEKGQNDCPTMALLEAVSSLPQLRQLELINFDIKPGFDKVIAKCVNLRTLLIIPTYVTQSATTNHVVMGGVSKLSHTLTYFIWGLTLELLKVTDLFIGQVENQKTGSKLGPTTPKKGTGDSIPILKPSPTDGEVKEGGQAPSQVDILALPNLQRVLSTLLPTTKIKILKVPFSATWRQTVTDGP